MRFEVIELGPAANKVVMVGRLDSTTVPTVETPFTAAVTGAGRNTLLDLRGLDFLSSLGIRMLLSVARVVTRRGGRVVLFGLQPMVSEVLTAMALDELLPIAASEEDALRRLAA